MTAADDRELQLPHRSQLSANYTLARARDDNSNLGRSPCSALESR